MSQLATTEKQLEAERKEKAMLSKELGTANALVGPPPHSSILDEQAAPPAVWV